MTYTPASTHTSIDSLRNNCTLVAVREATGRPDKEIIDAFFARGYVAHRGTNAFIWTAVKKDLGHELDEIDVAIEGRSWRTNPVVKSTSSWGTEYYRTLQTHTLTLGMFVKTFPEGVFLIRVDGHLLVVRDGVVVDPNMGRRPKLRRRVKKAYRVPNPAPSYVHKTPRVLKRSADPLVQFIGSSFRRSWTKSYAREMDAVSYVMTNGYRVMNWSGEDVGRSVRLSFILKNTGYGRADAEWDIARGRLVIISE